MNEFKMQFRPADVVGGSVRKNEGYGRKHYIAAFVMGRRMIHESRVPHRTATQAREYAEAVLSRYKTMAQAALNAFVESQHVADTN